jgi:superkiller protein 3
MSLTPITGESREEAFKSFITSLKHNREYAPAYTSLGVYYSEHASPPDPTRASKCFQKAFELDAREAEAARRLAEGFADEREWDLVEVVARRTIDGEGGMGAGVEEGDSVTSGKYLPTNAWAWKALGVVELVRDCTVKHMFNLMFCMTDKEELSRIHQGFSSRAPGRC